jgi:hypothetical protein
MLTPLQNVSMQFSHVEFPNVFEPDCEPGDWQFENVFTSFSKPPRVILTASDLGAEQSSGNFTAVVGIAQNVTATGFRLAARNSDCSPGVAHMNWLALLETDQPQEPVKHVRMGTLFPKRFRRDCEPGDWNTWDVRFSQPAFAADPVIFATAADRFAEAAAVYEHGDFSGWVRTNYATPAVPVARKRTTTGFTLLARNPDPDEGWSNFNYLALHETVAVAGVPSGGGAQIFVDSGQVAPLWFEPCSTFSNAWNQWAVTFDQAFLTPPTVLVTAFHVGRSGPAVAGMACYVTPNGFLLRARNTDCAAGEAGLNWVAFGCAVGCA